MSHEAEKIMYSMLRGSKFYQSKVVLKDISLSHLQQEANVLLLEDMDCNE